MFDPSAGTLTGALQLWRGALPLTRVGYGRGSQYRDLVPSAVRALQHWHVSTADLAEHAPTRPTTSTTTTSRPGEGDNTVYARRSVHVLARCWKDVELRGETS
eukprot:TRINITY_DN908_c0_g1_i2.p2 TRINITY_DN908_c0_g1~~TRINITY_DN908_c0_g1_i2.p2  ORF type:complete len:103 (+),score=9.42 TRINITY_DN908_c0_g1_i2:143-451(+)